MSWIMTYSGVHFPLLNPQPEHVCEPTTASSRGCFLGYNESLTMGGK